MPMFNLIEYSDNYSDTSGSLWQFKRDESPVTAAGNCDNVSTVNSTSFKYKSCFFKPLEAADTGVSKNVKIAVPLKHLSNFWRSLEMSLINCKIHLELNWTKDCVMSTIADTTFEITNTKSYVPVVTLSSKDDVKLVKLLKKGLKRPVYWIEYQTKIESRNLDNNSLTRFPIDASFQGVTRFFVFPFNNTTVSNNPINNTNNRVLRNSQTKYFLPLVNITNYNVVIDGINFYDQAINDSIKQYDEIRKTATGHRDDYATGCLLDYQYFKDHYNLIAVDLSKQKELETDSRAIQQIEFYGMLRTNSQVCTVLEKSKETMLEFYKGTVKVLWIV